MVTPVIFILLLAMKKFLIAIFLIEYCIAAHHFQGQTSSKSHLQADQPCPVYPEPVPLYVDGELPEVVQSALAKLDKFLQSQQQALQLPGILTNSIISVYIFQV